MDTNRSSEPDNGISLGYPASFPAYGTVQVGDEEQSPLSSEEKTKKKNLTSSIVSLSSFRDVSK